MNLRFLDEAINKIKVDVSTSIPWIYASDGDKLLCNPIGILTKYKTDRCVVTRDYLHIIFHCIFRHMYVNSLINQDLWDLSCDIASEYAIHCLDIQAAKTSRCNEQVAVFDKLLGEVKLITAEKIYRYYLSEELSEGQQQSLRNLFKADDHNIWYMQQDARVSYGFGVSNSSGKSLYESNNSESSSNEGSSAVAASLLAEHEWKKIAERMQQDLEHFSKLPGKDAGNLIQNLKNVNREHYNYEAFLKKFAVMHEAMKINDDEFDYIFYTYGLKLYKKVPLVEPLEYKEAKQVKEFVIAIDTSGSTSGDLVQKFVQKTYNILKSSESFATKVNIHIIQCDAVIQEDRKITNVDDFDEYLKTMKLHGLGGTDFRPVFRYVDQLLKNKEFTNLKGLIYFTDGCGEFPAKKPDYETAFIFIEDEFNNENIPSWAIKLVLSNEEIENW